VRKLGHLRVGAAAHEHVHVVDPRGADLEDGVALGLRRLLDRERAVDLA